MDVVCVGTKACQRETWSHRWLILVSKVGQPTRSVCFVDTIFVRSKNVADKMYPLVNFF